MTLGIGCLLILLLYIVCAFLGGWVAMMLWNLVISPLFHMQHINYWMGFGIAVLLAFVGGFFRSTSSSS